jgi:demethylmenaquinone methyltransferase/2-methoxy-6-polyprenyl-1,4-benzoquinol methylase
MLVAMGTWIEKSPEVVGARYDRLAPIYGLFEWLYALPLLGVRRRSVEALRLRPGDCVLELGCGSGRNFALIEQRIGPDGALFGVDLSPRMLARANRLVRRRGWANVRLTCGDAASFAPPRPVHAALFSFSYSTMRDRSGILRAAWGHLEAGGRLVLTDATLRPGWPRRLFRSLSVWVSDRTLLGRPDTEPAEDLASLAGPVEVQQISFAPLIADYVICAGTKPTSDRG